MIQCSDWTSWEGRQRMLFKCNNSAERSSRLLTTVLLLAGVFAGCSDRNQPAEQPPADTPLQQFESSAQPEPASQGKADNNEKAVGGEQPVAAPLDLSLPSDFEDEGVRDLSEEEQSRFQTEDYFKKSEDDKRVKVHSKVYVKDGTTLDSARQDYRGSLEGGEVGVEYQMK